MAYEVAEEHEREPDHGHERERRECDLRGHGALGRDARNRDERDEGRNLRQNDRHRHLAREDVELCPDRWKLSRALLEDARLKGHVPAVELEHAHALDHLNAPRDALVRDRHAKRARPSQRLDEVQVGRDEEEQSEDADERRPAHEQHEQHRRHEDHQRRRPQLMEQWQRVEQLLRVVEQQVRN